MKPDPAHLLLSQQERAPSWHATLDLCFEADSVSAKNPTRRANPRTLLTLNAHTGPMRVQKALYPEGGEVCHAIVVHPPGGIAGGDALALQVRVGAGAHAQLTTPGAGKWYRAFGAPAQFTQQWQLQGDAVLEWLPQESIVFDGAHAYSQVNLSLAQESSAILWDILCLGRPASAEPYAHGCYTSRWLVEIEGRVLWREQAVLHGGAALLQSPLGLHGRSVSGMMLASTPHTRSAHDAVGVSALQAVRAVSPQAFGAGLLAGATPLPCGLMLRALAHEAEAVRAYFAACWQVLRPRLLARAFVEPRIWRT